MLKKTSILLAAGIFLITAIGSIYAYQALQGPTGVIQYNPSKAYNGYTLFAPSGELIYLIDMNGYVVNTWPRNGGGSVQIYENGNILQAAGSRGEQGKYQILDWNGKVVWESAPPAHRTDIERIHHDQILVFNKKLNAYTILGIISRKLSLEDALAAGADPQKAQACAPDGIIEMDMNGNIVWEWWSFDHVIQDLFPDKVNYVGEGKTIADYPGKRDMNWGRGVSRDFVHFNSLDYNPELGQIAVNHSTGSEFWIIDHDGTFIPGDPEGSKALAAGPEGDFLFRWGNSSIYGAGKGPSYEYGISSLGDQQTFFTHDIQWIKPGLPGAGHFLYWDNNSRRPGNTFSQILEIDPYDGPMEEGIYISEVEAGYTKSEEDNPEQSFSNQSNQIVWKFNTIMYDQWAKGFYSIHASGCQRLPNGNTMGCATEDGHIVEVTYGDPENNVLPEVVWEYIIPVTEQHGVVETLRFDMKNESFRAYRYGPEHQGLVGRDLTPKGTIAEFYEASKFSDSQIKPEPGDEENRGERKVRRGETRN